MTSVASEENRAIVARAFDAWRSGRAAITDLFAPEMRWRIEGRSLVAGEYASTADFVERVLAPFALRFPRDEPFRPTVIRSVIADGDPVVVIWDGHGTATDGAVYENSYAWIMRLNDSGRVVDGHAFFDAKAFDELWTRVPPRVG